MSIQLFRSALLICKHVGWVMLASIACGSPHAMAASIPHAFSIDVGIVSATGTSTFSANRDGRTYFFEASVEILSGAPRVKGDLYFGVLGPGGTVSYTWLKRDGIYVLERGMTPIQEDINLAMPSSISSAQIVGHQLEFSLSQAQSPGLYFAFALLVGANLSPSETQNWLQIEVTPLLVK